MNRSLTLNDLRTKIALANSWRRSPTLTHITVPSRDFFSMRQELRELQLYARKLNQTVVYDGIDACQFTMMDVLIDC